MAENGPGGREVGRVSLRVLPDTSRFLPSLKKYAERVERTVAVRLGTEIDSRGLEADVQRISRTIEASAPTIRVPAAPVTDGFARDLQAQVRAASRAIEANIPLTADGERFRRQIVGEVAKLEAEIQRLDIEVPLDVESAARARAQLKARVLELQGIARLNGIEIPVSAGDAAGGGSLLGLSPTTLATIAGVAAVLAGGTIAALPALVASLVAPIGVIALGMEGIKAAAQVAVPAFDAIRQAISNTFAKDLAGAFATLAAILPQITQPLERIASALSGAFTVIIDQIASPDGMSALKGILDGIADAMEILAPALGPMTQLFLDIAQTGMQAFVDNAPAFRDLLLTITDIFTQLNESGVIKLAADAFAGFVFVTTAAIGGISAALVIAASVIGVLQGIVAGIGDFVVSALAKFFIFSAGVKSRIDDVVRIIRTLPSRAAAALSDLGSLLFGSGAALIQGLIDGLLSKIRPLLGVVGSIAQIIKDHFPGSPVKSGPLTSWNNGGAGKRLGDMLASGLDSSKSTVRAASLGLAGAVSTPSLVGAGVGAASGSSGATDHFALADTLTDAMRQTHLSVSVRETDRALTRHRNGRQGL